MAIYQILDITPDSAWAEPSEFFPSLVGLCFSAEPSQLRHESSYPKGFVFASQINILASDNPVLSNGPISVAFMRVKRLFK